jgi:hypothetical protein
MSNRWQPAALVSAAPPKDPKQLETSLLSVSMM